MHGDEENAAEEHYEPFTQGKRKTPWQAFPDTSSEAPGSGSGAAGRSNAMLGLLGLAGVGSALRESILYTWCLTYFALGLYLNCAHVCWVQGGQPLRARMQLGQVLLLP